MQNTDKLTEWAALDNKFSQFRPFELVKVSIEAQRELQALVAPETLTYWRATNRKAEYADVKRGVAIISRNHADNTQEAGMSVCDALAYAWGQGYKYVYKVDGDLVGEGSDGEPVLTNVKVASPLMDADDAIANDEQRARTRAVCTELAEKLPVSVNELIRLLHHSF